VTLLFERMGESPPFDFPITGTPKKKESMVRHDTIIRSMCLGVILVTLVFPGHLSASTDPGIARGQRNKPLVVGGDRDYPPYEYLDERGRPSGYNVDLIRAVAQVMGMNIEIRLGPWAQVRNALETGKIDMIEGMFSSPERMNYVDFSVPHTIIHHAVFIRKEGIRIEALEDLKGKEIIVQKGDIMHDYVLAKGLSTRVVLVESPVEALRILSSGRHDCALLLESQGLFLAHKYRLSNITTTGPPFAPDEYCFAVKKGNDRLLAQLNQGIGIIKATGRYNEIHDKWMGTLQTGGISADEAFRWVAFVVGPLILLLVAVVLWSWSLRSQVRRRTDQLSEELAERKQAEEALRQSEAKFRFLTEKMNDVIWTADMDFRVTYVSPSIEKALGFTPEERLNQQVAETMTPESYARALQLLTAEIEREQDPTADPERTVKLDIEYYHKSGSTVWMENVISAIRDDGGTIIGIHGVSRDITERKQADLERKRLESQLSQAQKMESIGTLAGGIAHDFNNILSAIIGYTELALDDSSDPVKVQRGLKEVLKAGERARGLVKQILTFSRKTDADYSPLVLRTVIKESLRMLRSVMPTTIEIRQNLIDSGLVMADPTQIHQVMINLCTNAVHAMDETGGVLMVELKRESLEEEASGGLGLHPGSYLRITVQDTGHGMTPEVMERIFDPYFTTKATGQGTGLGLAVVHGIVKSHGGAITCSSVPGYGTTFHLYLPEIEPGRNEEKVPDGRSLQTGTERILMVDDEPTLADLVEKMLGGLGYSVTSRTSSEEALELFRKDPDRFDLVISDMTMPGLTGDRLAQRLLEIRRDIPIILCTGYSERITEERAKSIGIRKFILKPLTRDSLAEAVRSVLDRR